MLYAILADALALFHLAYVAFVVVGELVILVGAAFGCKWVRNPWFRSLHLLAIAVVALEAVGHIDCPLTVLENHWRVLAGQEPSTVSFVQRLVDRVMLNNLWQQSTYEIIHISFGVLVLATYVLLPPRFRKARAAQPAAPSGATLR